jgi:hypothetical protein
VASRLEASHSSCPRTRASDRSTEEFCRASVAIGGDEIGLFNDAEHETTLISMRKRHIMYFSTTHVLFVVDACAFVVDTCTFQRCAVVNEDAHAQLGRCIYLNDMVSIKK